MIRHVPVPRGFADWRRTARALLQAEIPPERVMFSSQPSLFGLPISFKAPAPPMCVPEVFLDMARAVACHRDEHRFALLYRVLWRLTHGESQLLKITVDPDVHRLTMLERQVRSDLHKMHAFVRFRRIADPSGVCYLAWHRPDHRIVRLAAPFFRDRFRTMRWTIFTPDESVQWDLRRLRFGPGVPRHLAPVAQDELESLWKEYYASIFNPARVKVRAMKRSMPVRHWATLPEADIIDDLLRNAPERVRAMLEAQEQTVLSRPRDFDVPGASGPCPSGRSP